MFGSNGDGMNMGISVATALKIFKPPPYALSLGEIKSLHFQSVATKGVSECFTIIGMFHKACSMNIVQCSIGAHCRTFFSDDETSGLKVSISVLWPGKEPVYRRLIDFQWARLQRGDN